MAASTGLFQFSPYQSEEVIPACAEMTTDPLGQVVAIITAYLPEGTGSSLYDWQRCFYLRVDFAREKVELLLSDEGHYYLEGTWELDAHDEETREELLLPGIDEPDTTALAALASTAAELRIAPPDPDIRASWGGDLTFGEGVPADDWPGPPDQA